MSDVSEIDYINRIDYSKGFRRFRIKWHLEDLNKPKESTVFKTTVIDGQREIILSWKLGIDDYVDEDTNAWIGASLETPDKITPMVYRVLLSSSGNVLFDKSSFGVVGNEYSGYGDIVHSSEFDGFPDDDMMLHFWMDIPNDILIGDNSDKMSVSGMDGSSQKRNNDVFLLDSAKVFNRVTGAKAGDSSSNVSVIIVKKKVCSGRKRGIGKEVRRFHCHTDILAARSTVFERMFGEAEWKENCIENDRSVKIDDIEAQVMEMVLRFIYTSKLPDPSTDEVDLFNVIYAADKYDLTELKNWCGGILIHKHKSARSRIEQLILADRHNLVQLKSVCLAQLSMCFHMAFSNHAMVKDIPSDLWSEIMKAIADGQVATEIKVEEEENEEESDSTG